LLGLSDSQEGSESSEDKEYREKLEKLLGEPVVNAFKDILLYDPMLKVNSLYKERVSEKNIYKKFNDAIVEKILLDNGIDLNKLLVESTNRAKEILKKIFDINTKHGKNIIRGDFADYL
jgi:TFIIF-interacting CTD phosphatase-like protein